MRVSATTRPRRRRTNRRVLVRSLRLGEQGSRQHLVRARRSAEGDLAVGEIVPDRRMLRRTMPAHSVGLKMWNCPSGSARVDRRLQRRLRLSSPDPRSVTPVQHLRRPSRPSRCPAEFGQGRPSPRVGASRVPVKPRRHRETMRATMQEVPRRSDVAAVARGAVGKAGPPKAMSSSADAGGSETANRSAGTSCAFRFART